MDDPNTTNQQPDTPKPLPTPKDKGSAREVWNRGAQCLSALVRFLILAALFVGVAKTLCTFRELAGGIGGTTIASTKQRVITTPSGEIVTSTSGILKLLIAPSTNVEKQPPDVDGKSSDVLLLPVERTERCPVVLPYIASLAACVIVLCAFVWGIVRVWRED